MGFGTLFAAKAETRTNVARLPVSSEIDFATARILHDQTVTA